MGLFRRKKGRHALGAAVTSIPSGPPVGLAPVPAMRPAAPAGEPDVMTSIAQLIATGEAWNEPGERPVRPAVAVAPPPPPAPAPPPPPPTPPAAPAAQQALEDALATLTGAGAASATPEPPSTQAVPQVAQPRVQLGFRDGTSTTLDPSSTQSQALEQLAQSLTRRD